MRTMMLTIAVLFVVNTLKAQWDPDVRLTSTPDISGLSSNFARCIAASGDSVHVVWTEQQNGITEVYYKRSADEGLTWGTDVRLTDDDGMKSNNPTVAVSGNSVHVVWRDYRDGIEEIYYTRSVDGGNTWGAQIRLTNDPGLSYSPGILADGSMLHVVWVDSRDGISATPRQIYYKRSTDGGWGWEPDQRLSQSPSYAVNPSISGSGQDVHVAWNDKRDGNMEIYYLHSPDGGSTWDPEQGLTSDPDLSQLPSIAVAGENVYLAWQTSVSSTNAQVWYKHSTDRGITWDASQQVTSALAYHDAPNIAASGSLVHLVWQDNRSGNDDCWYSFTSDDGGTWSADTRLNDVSFESKRPFIAVSGSVLHTIWYDYRAMNYEIFYKRNPSGGFAVGVDKNQGNTADQPVRIYPNPAADRAWFIPGPGSQKPDHFRVKDISGRTVKEGTLGFSNDPGGCSIHVGDLPCGLYFVGFLSGNKSSVTKLIIQR